MNLIVWLLSGGLLSSVVARFFAPDSVSVTGDLVWGIAGALVGGLLSAFYMPATPIGSLDEHSFSPGAAVWANIISALFLIFFNWYHR